MRKLNRIKIVLKHLSGSLHRPKLKIVRYYPKKFDQLWQSHSAQKLTRFIKHRCYP